MRRENLLAEGRKLERHRAVGIERERGAVEHQFVLAAELIDIDQRQAGFGDAGHHDIEADFALVAPIGRAVGHDQDFGAGLGETLDDVLVVAPVGPGVLADRQAEPHAAEIHRPRQRPGSEDALLVEHAVIRQIDLEAQRLDAAAGEQRIGVVELAVFDPGRADQHRRPAVGGLARQRLDRGPAGRLESRLEHQVFRRIAGDEQFGKSDDVGTIVRGAGARLAGKLQIAGNIADDRIELRYRNGQTIGGRSVHGAGLEHDRQQGNPVQLSIYALSRLNAACRSDMARI